MKYAVITFGCRVNQADSLGFEEELRLKGASAAPPDQADIVVVNTCSVTATADQGARQTIRRVARANPSARIVVTGCYATRRPDEIRSLPNVVRVVPNDDKPRLLNLAAADLGLTTAQRFGAGEGSCGAAIEPGVAGRTAFTLRVQTGCAEPCAYCIIPTTRGAPRSQPEEAVLKEVDRVAAAGFKEIALTGVHLGSYGRDLNPASSLVALLRALAEHERQRPARDAAGKRGNAAPSTLRPLDPSKGSPSSQVQSRDDRLGVVPSPAEGRQAQGRPELHRRGSASDPSTELRVDLSPPKVERGWGPASIETDVLFRISSLEPMDCSRDVVDLVAVSGRFAPHFHLPLQHASNRVLRAMRRPYSIEQYAALVDGIRAQIPAASIGSDIIVGFPGETDDDFAQLASYLERSPLTHVHVFPYSDRPGTAASAMRGKVGGVVVRERARRVREIGQGLTTRFRDSQIGTVHRGLTLEDGSLVVTGNYLKVRIPPGRPRNEWVMVKITEAGETMRGESW